MLNLKIPLEKAIRLLNERINDLKKIRKNNYGGVDFGDVVRWASATITVVEGIYGVDDKHSTQIQNLDIPKSSGDLSRDAQNLVLS